jgi:hypothetical protein
VRPSLFAFFALLALAVVACSSGGSIQPEPAYPLHGGASARGVSTSSWSAPTAGTSTSIPYDPPPRPLDGEASAASVVVRPDVVVVSFAVRAIADEPDAALAVLEHALRATVLPPFAELGSVKVRMRGTQVEHAARKERKKAKSEVEDRAAYAVSLQGALEYALAPAQDYWERARLVTRIDGLRDRIERASHAEASPFEASIEPPHAGVRDPEAQRAELLSRWIAKRKQFAREAKSADLAVAIDACRPPAEIAVRVLSLEEVELTLPIDCVRDQGSGRSRPTSL